MTEAAEKTFSFDDFELSGAKRLLLKKGEAVALNSRTFDLLLTLVENRGRILSKDELLETVWEGQFVEENNLTVHISTLRKIFGEKKDEHRFIVTIPGKGYKFVGGETSIVAANQTPKPSAKSFDNGEKIIGRDAEIAEIKNILRASDKCLLTLTGAGGSGKTTLARAVADKMRMEFADGVFFVELAAVNQPELFIGTLAKTLAVDESSNKSLLENVKNFLQNRRILLVLDNFEQIISAADWLREIYDFAANLKILITSRAPLRLKFEREKSVAPLAVPPSDANLSAEQLIAFAAVELFVARAQTARPNFTLNEENAPFV
ncbi:MAG TPA: winged helix-turn-helix domain-containing protein, partial [Pyrinomonadaceae bacterium]|nr:winged helix-turn-helix domain-containing protein [Pyrinomonadaceae bacterium]